MNILDHMIGQMDRTPIRGLKKTLELFSELKHSFPEIKISELSKVRLSEWEETKTLKPLITKLLDD